MSWTKLKETMSRDRPGNLTFLNASTICSSVGVDILLLLFEPLERVVNDGDGVGCRGDHVHRIHVGCVDEPALDHGCAHPVDETRPHCTDENEWMLLHVLHLKELPHHEKLERGPNAARKDDEGGREAYEMVESGEEGAMPEDLVDEGDASLFVREVNGQPERPRLSPGLPLDGAGIRGLHEPRAAAGDDVDPHPCQRCAERLHLVINRVAMPDAGASEDRDAVVLDVLRLDLVEVVDRLPELVDCLVENVAGIDPPRLARLSLAQGFQFGGGRGRFGHAVGSREL